MPPFFEKIAFMGRKVPLDPCCFNPLPFTQAVNEVWAMGKKSLIETVERGYPASDSEPVFWLLRVLFPDSPAGDDRAEFLPRPAAPQGLAAANAALSPDGH